MVDSGIIVKKRGLQLLTLGRVFALLLTLITLTYNNSVDLPFLSNVIYLLLLVSVGNLFLLSKLHNLEKIGFFQLCFDIILISSSFKVLSGTNFFALYLVLIVCGSLLLKSSSTIIIAAFSGLCYGFALSISSEVYVSSYELLLSYAALIASALVSTYYVRQIEGLKVSISEKNKELEKVNLNKLHLIESFSEGIVTLDLNDAITGINEAAKILLGITQDDTNDCVLNSLIERSAILDKSKIVNLKEGDSAEIKSFVTDKPTVLKCTLQNIKNNDGLESGKILFISDVGELKSIEEKLNNHEKMVRLVKSINDTDTLVKNNIPEIIGDNQLLKELLLVVEQAAPTEAPILLLGESGTGKELIARAIHNLSLRSKSQFIAVNCSAIPEHLLESELFGHKKGSFTGADRDTLGLFREAEGGTLFLDEIGELPIHLQSKLLRVLQEGLVRPVGSSKEIKIDVRIVAATNKNLKELVLKNQFREDLFYRLRVIELVIPPLRSRKNDIPHLIFHFLKQAGINTDNVKISNEAWNLLLQYNYPGNIRELENIIHRARVLGAGAILPEHLPEDVRLYKDKELSSNLQVDDYSRFPVVLDKILSDVERTYLIQALSKAQGVKTDAAKLLGMNFRSFRYRLKKYGLDNEGIEISEEAEFTKHV